MSFSFVVAVVCFAVIANAVHPERRPDLGEFQDEFKCFPHETPWLAVLRNYESDPYFGGKAKCIRVTQSAPLQGDVAEGTVEYAGTERVKTKLTLTRTEGYHHKNALNATFLDGPGQGKEFRLFSIYSECDKCKLYRNPYAGENACSLFVPARLRNQIDPACQFIFNLHCGTDNHYRLLDDTCPF
ncbi:hypothetical protein V5799_003739 [Amblyomma americanum]|uniref:Lipocal-1 1 n=1 Tax=Amblyomma americanum TaxID=6943 RepID=A0AAQ4D839_AMBAM